MPSDRGVLEKLDLIGNSQVRRILATLNTDPFSVKQLAERLEMSQATIYRHVKQLEEHDLVTARVFVSAEGNHYRVYECTFGSAVITLNGDEYTAYFPEKGSTSAKLVELWKEIHQSVVE